MITFEISKIGHCARTLSAEILGRLPEKNDPEGEYRLFLAAREGRRHEQFIREDLPEHGWKSINNEGISCKDCGREGWHVQQEFDGYQLVGHFDDLVTPMAETNPHIAEYKALGRFTCQQLVKEGVYNHRTYYTQVSAYHHLAGFPILYVVKNRDTGQMHLDEIEPMEMDSITKRLDALAGFISRQQVAPCDQRPWQIDHWSCTDLCAISRLEQSLQKVAD